MKKLIFILLLICFFANAQTIKEINIKDKTLLPLIPIEKGDKISPSLIKSIIVNLYKTGLFYNVKVRTEKDGNSVIVFIETIPAKFFGELKTEGKIGIKKRRLKKLYKEFYPLGEIYRQEKLDIFLNTLKEKFKELGYPKAEIKYTLEEKDKIVYPTINIQCGEPLVVASIKTNNKKLFSKFVKVKKNQVYNKELFLHGLKKLRKYLREKHFLNSEVSFKEEVKGNKVYLTIKIDKGKKFTIKSKNLKIGEDETSNICAFLKSGKINPATIKLTEKNLYFKALKSGFYEPEIGIDINKDSLYCEVKNPKKLKIEKIIIDSDFPLKISENPQFFNKLTKSNLYSSIKEQLSGKGYFNPQVKFNYDTETKILTVKVKKGNILKISSINLNSDIKLPQRFLTNMVKPGDIFNNEKVSEIIKTLKSYLIGKGYFNPQVNVKIGKPVKGKVPLTININSGKIVKLDHIVILGNNKVKKKHILKLAGFKEGDIVCQYCLDNFKNNLEFSGLFERASFDLIDKGKNKATLLIKLNENRLYSFSYAIGFNSDEGLRLTAKIRKKYFFNSFLTAATIFRVSSKRAQGYFTVAGEKHFLSSIYFTLEDKNDYRFSRYGLSLSYRGKILSHLKHIESIEFTKNNLTNIRIPMIEIEKELQPDYTIGFRTNILYDRRDNILFPLKGYFLNLNVFPAYVLNDSKFFLKTSLKTGIYFKNMEFITTIGKIFTRNNYQVPIPQRFFTGGSTNLRISSFEKAGPLFSTGVPKGGNFIFVFSAEYKHHLKDIYYLTLFSDIGNVWEDSSDFSFKSCIKDAGIGLLIKTPVGPMKIQLATNLDQDTFPSKYKLVFSFGTTF